MSEIPTIDGIRMGFIGRQPVTQEMVDEWMKVIDDFSNYVLTELRSPPREPDQLSAISLRCYLNPWRDDGVFVAENKEIKPYPGARNVDGSSVYPSMPDTPFRFPHQLPHDFARRLVACWNACRGISTEDLEIRGFDRSPPQNEREGAINDLGEERTRSQKAGP